MAVVRIAPASPADDLMAALNEPGDLPYILVIDKRHAVGSDELDALLRAVARPGVATASPVPAGHSQLHTYPVHELCPPPPTLPTPCAELCLLDPEALSSLGADLLGDRARSGALRVADLVAELADRLLRMGWRHVASPGLALLWDPVLPDLSSRWSRRRSAAIETVGPSNTGLEAHRSWASTRIRGTRLLVDGACLTADLHTGTQHLVMEITRHLKQTRPNNHVAVAVPTDSVEDIRGLLADESVEIVERHGSHQVDVVYRPYQMLRPTEIAFLAENGQRLITSQLDMIGYSNPYYHPSPELFLLSRNLQRFLMRTSDCVTFISDYGRQAAVDECPDLQADRLHVVSCGADPHPSIPTAPRDAPSGRFLLCLSATFWHKNRCHAISTFAEMVRLHGYAGSLVIAGPEPFYGRSTDAEDALLAELPQEVSARVHRLGQVGDPEKWWLLANADATVYPSVVEGFGLVPFEAAAVGTPCLVYSGTAPGEILGGTTATIATWNHRAWAERLATWTTDVGAATQAISEVLRIAEDQTWEQCAERTWTAIDAALALPRHSRLAEEGGPLSRITNASELAVGIGSRFMTVRALPAIQRRVERVAQRPRTGG